MKISKINLKTLISGSNEALSDYLVSKCFFCQKTCSLPYNTFLNLHKLSGNREFFCGFCVRGGFNNRGNKDVLIMSFKNVFNYYYCHRYLSLKNMWISEIRDIVEKHKEVGLSNPVFSYDEESMNWFVNFFKVGCTRKRIILEEVERTTISIIDSLDLRILAPEVKQESFRQKYLSAIKLFNRKRYRPKDKKVLSPTIGNCRSEIVF